MFTCCPHCKTCFRITKPQLEIAQGKVRCGKCKQIFNGKLHLSDDIPKAARPVVHKPAKKVVETVPATIQPETEPPAEPEAVTAAEPLSPPEGKPATKKKNMRSARAPARNLDLDLFSSQDFTGAIENEDEDDSWLDNLDEEEAEEHDEEYEYDEFDDDEDVVEETEIIEMDDEHLDIFASLEKIIPADLHADSEQLKDDEEKFLDDEITQSEILQSELDSAIEALAQYEAEAESASADSVFEYLPDEEVAEDEAREPEQEPADFAAEPEPEPPADDGKAEVNQPPSAYEYVDPDELLDEEKNISEILRDMDSQLKQTIGGDEYDQPLITTDEEDEPAETDDPSIFFKPDEWVLSQHENEAESQHAQPVASRESQQEKDSFESEFLASLDSTLAEAADTAEAPVEPPAEKPAKAKKITYEDEEDPFLGFDTGIETGAPAIPGPIHDLPGPGAHDDELPYRLREDSGTQAREHGIAYYLGGFVAIVLLTAGLLLQLAVFRSSDVVEHYPALEPMMTRLCSKLPCRYTSRTDVGRIKLLSRDIRVHPSAQNALLITATMVNRAGFPQPYPDIQITLSDLSGEVVAQRRFSPREYLGREPSPFLRMQVGKPVKIALEVIDPGKDAVNFEFTFHDKIRQPN